MSKSFQVPAPIVVKPFDPSDSGSKPETVTFLKFATFIWLDDPNAYTDAQGRSSIVKQRRWLGVIGKFEAAQPGDWITLEDDDYLTLRTIVEAPTRRYANGRITMACLPFSDAVLDAVEKIPA